jgi:L-lactate dehydrogenase complex protein LldG
VTTAREEVLRRVRDALGDVPSEERAKDVTVPGDYLRSHADGGLVELFAERVRDYRARVTLVPEAGVAEAVRAALEERGAGAVVVPGGFPERWFPSGPWQRLEDDGPLSTPELAAAHAVLTTAALGIAVTGTLALDAGPGQGRRALTLLPDYHLCVIRVEQIVPDVPDAVRLLDPARPLTFVSGPSATSDIEFNRVEGVHGPRTLDVLVVTTEESA